MDAKRTLSGRSPLPPKPPITHCVALWILYIIYYILLVLHMSPSGDEKFRCKCSTFAISSPWGGTNEVLLNLADLRVLQMKSCKSSVGQNEVQVGAWSSVESPSAVQVALGDHLENKLSSSDAGSLQEASKSSKLSPGGVQKASKRLQIAPKRHPKAPS